MAKDEETLNGLCPQCNGTVEVYVAHGKLRVRAHTHEVQRWRSTAHLACPVRALDGADALQRMLDSNARDVAAREANRAAAEKVLADRTKDHENAKARAEAYAARVAAMMAKVGR